MTLISKLSRIVSSWLDLLDLERMSQASYRAMAINRLAHDLEVLFHSHK